MDKRILKVIETVKKYDNIFVGIIIFLSIFGITLNVFVTNSDELWNFQNIYKMYNGFQIYKDANVIITPLFFYLGELLFKMLGANFLTFRIYNIIIIFFLYFFTYLLLKNLKINKNSSLFVVVFLILFDKYALILTQANYNILAVMLCILGVYIYTKNNKYNNLSQGILLFLILMTKQNIGIFYAIGIFVYEILSKSNLKDIINNLLLKYITSFILLVCFLTFYYTTGNLYSMVNYTILGLSEFANKNLCIDIVSTISIIFFISIDIVLTVFFIKNNKIAIKDIQKNQLILLASFSIPMSLIIFPIMNKAHFMLAFYLLLIWFIYLINIIYKEITTNKIEKIINIVLVIYVIFSCTFSIGSFIFWNTHINDETYYLKKEEPFYGGVLNDNLIKNINTMVEYIENNSNNVVVLSGKAAFYMVPTKRSNGMMDLPFKGNLGKGGEQGLIEEIKMLEETEILIERDEQEMQWQESEKVREYIINNMEKIGEIEEFDIYK